MVLIDGFYEIPHSCMEYVSHDYGLIYFYMDF